MMHYAFKHKTDFMKAIQNAVARGYTRYCSGSTTAKKALVMAYKFEDRGYGISMTTQQKWRAKKAGKATSTLISLAVGEKVSWFLLVTAGEGIVEQVENLRDAKSKKERIEFTGYELVVQPRPKDKAAWTWRMTQATKNEWAERIGNAVRVRNDDSEIRQCLWSLARVPGFAQSRRDAFKLFRGMQGDYKRIKRSEWPYRGLWVAFHGRFKAGEKIPLG